MAVITKINGIKCRHAIVTPACRSHKGNAVSAIEATERLLDAYNDIVTAEINEDANFHFVLVVDRDSK